METKGELTTTVDHLPILTRQVDGDPRIGGTVGHGDVAIGIPLLLVRGDEDLEIPCRVHDGNGEGRPNPETGVELLPALLFEGDLTLLMDLERRTHVSGNC